MPTAHTAEAPAGITPRPWLTADEAADYLKITRRTLDRWRAAGILTGYRMGPRLVRFRCDDLDALLTPAEQGDRHA